MSIRRTERKGAFETNSSSSHTICMAYTDVFEDTIPENSEGEIEIFSGEFGWGPEKFNDAATKASYCLTGIMGSLYSDDSDDSDDRQSFSKDEIMSMLDRDSHKSRLEMLDRVLREQLGKPIRYVREKGFYAWGYIDHESQAVPSDAFESEHILKNFIFNPSSILIISNDNGGFDDYMYD